jgi:hypothetical protein
VVGDAYYAKKTFVDGVTHAGKTFVGKLRVDANLKYKYIGPRTGKPGRPQKFAGKVDWKDFSRWTLISGGDQSPAGAGLGARNQEQTVYSSVLYAPALKRFVLVVCIIWQFKARTARKVPSCEQEDQFRREVLFSTNLEMPALEVIECYRARFEMEFSFRDAKRPKPIRCWFRAKKARLILNRKAVSSGVFFSCLTALTMR